MPQGVWVRVPVVAPYYSVSSASGLVPEARGGRPPIRRTCGDIAQLGERFAGSEEADGSSPSISTIYLYQLNAVALGIIEFLGAFDEFKALGTTTERCWSVQCVWRLRPVIRMYR